MIFYHYIFKNIKHQCFTKIPPKKENRPRLKNFSYGNPVERITSRN